MGGGGRVRLVRTAEGSRDLQGRCRTFHDDRESAFDGLRGQLQLTASVAVQAAAVFDDPPDPDALPSARTVTRPR